MPWWYLALEGAETWKRPPWEVYGGSPVIWHTRWRYLRNERAKIEAAKQRKRNLKALMNR